MRLNFLLTFAALLVAPQALATFVSPDVTVPLSLTATIVEDHDVVFDNAHGMVTLEPLGPLPDASDVSGYELLSNGDLLLCFDTGTELLGPVFASPGDVVRYDGREQHQEAPRHGRNGRERDVSGRRRTVVTATMSPRPR